MLYLNGEIERVMVIYTSSIFGLPLPGEEREWLYKDKIFVHSINQGPPYTI